MLSIIIAAIESGPAGTARAVHTLKDGVRFAYKYTRTHKLALQLFFFVLMNDVQPTDEPESVITAALLRAGALIPKKE
jgi:hypothetical protein